MSELHRFIFEGMPVRGMLVRLTGDWKEVLRRRAASDAHPPPVRSLLGQMAAAGVLMQASIRFNGALVLQVFGDGPVKLAVAEVQADLAFRVTGTVVGEVPADAQLAALLNVHGGGRCAITLDPKEKRPGQQPYQGVVTTHDKPFSPKDHDAFTINMIWLGVWRRGEIQYQHPDDAKRAALVRRKTPS